MYRLANLILYPVTTKFQENSPDFLTDHRTQGIFPSNSRFETGVRCVNFVDSYKEFLNFRFSKPLICLFYKLIYFYTVRYDGYEHVRKFFTKKLRGARYHEIISLFHIFSHKSL